MKPKAKFAKVIPREVHLIKVLPRRDYTPAPQITEAYILGVLHDGTVRKRTYRIGTKNKKFADIIAKGIKDLGKSAWIYKEGEDRNYWIVEFSKNLLNKTEIKSRQNRIDFIKGFFDAEGGIARSQNVRFYLYFCQKNKYILQKIKECLSDFGIATGQIHNPSKRVDPDYWRFYISNKSYADFAKIIGSNHPEKFPLLRMKI